MARAERRVRYRRERERARRYSTGFPRHPRVLSLYSGARKIALGDDERSVHHPILQRLAQMFDGDRGIAGEIGDRPGDLEDAVKAARGESQAFRRSFEQALTGSIES